MDLVASLARAFGPWQSLYADSTLVSTVVTALHVMTLLIGGGLAIAADRMTLRTLARPLADRTALLAELRSVHRPIVVSLALLFGSGAALAAADVEVFLGSPVFWVKLGLLALLLLNGLLLYDTESRLQAADRGPGAERLWRRLAFTARTSLSLWLLTALSGTVLTAVA